MRFEQSYALITGACGGLGKAFCAECASRQINLVLVDLPRTGLEALGDFLTKNFHIHVVCVEADLSKALDCEVLFSRLHIARIRVNMVINNAGIGGTCRFMSQNAEYYARQINVNATITAMLCRLFVERAKNIEGPCYVLNVGSMAGFLSLPGKHVYTASKVFIASFTSSLRLELKDTNIHVSLLTPGAMNTTLALTAKHQQFRGLAKKSIMDPAEVARIAIDQMLKGKKLIVPGALNKMTRLLSILLPTQMIFRMAQRQMEKLHENSSPGPLAYSDTERPA